MSMLNLFKHLMVLTAIATINACSGGEPQAAPNSLGANQEAKFVPPVRLSRVRPTNEHRHRGRTWMSPQAQETTLLYVADEETNDVYALSYPGGKWMGALTDLEGLNGLCSDGSGNVFVSQYDAQNVEEFAHGGTSPIGTLTVEGYPDGCSVDPTTGNLAVATFGGSSPSGSGGIWIIKHGSGSGKLYQDPAIAYYWPPGYDSHGNVFVQGWDFYELPHLAVLHAGSSHFTNINVNYAMGLPGGVMWDGSHLAVTDQLYMGSRLSAIYRVSVSGSQGKLVGTTLLKPSSNCPHESDAFQPWIQDGTVIGGNLYCRTIEYWQYPAAGKPTKFLPGISVEPVGETLSK